MNTIANSSTKERHSSLRDWRPSYPSQESTSLATMAYWSCAARPNHRWRGLVTPAKRGKGAKCLSNKGVASPAEHHAAMTWAQRLKRVFSIDIEVCGRCGGPVRIIVDASNRCIEDQGIIDQILDHLRRKKQDTPTRPLLLPRAWYHHPGVNGH